MNIVIMAFFCWSSNKPCISFPLFMPAQGNGNIFIWKEELKVWANTVLDLKERTSLLSLSLLIYQCFRLLNQILTVILSSLSSRGEPSFFHEIVGSGWPRGGWHSITAGSPTATMTSEGFCLKSSRRTAGTRWNHYAQEHHVQSLISELQKWHLLRQTTANSYRNTCWRI